MAMTIGMPIYRLLVAVLLIAVFCVIAPADDARLPEPLFLKAAELWKQGKSTDALKSFDESLTAFGEGKIPLAGKVMKAALLADIGRHEESEACWLEVARLETALKVYALRTVVGSRLRRGALESAAAALNDLISIDGIRNNRDLALDVADAFVDSDEFARATALFQKVLNSRSRGSYADRARIGLADCAEGAGDVGRTILRLRSAQLNHSLASTFATASEREKQLASAIGDKPKPFTEDQYLSLSRKLRNAPRYDMALELLQEWLNYHLNTQRRERIELETIETLYRKRANDEGLACCRAFYDAFPKSSLSNDVRYLELRLHVRIGGTEQVKAIASVLRGRGVPHSMRHNVGVVLASYLIGIGDVVGGLDVYRDVYGSSVSRNAKREILWRAGVAALRAEQNNRAVTNLRALVRLNPSGDMGYAAYYWLAIAESRLGNRELALKAALRLIERYPYHYYGVRAKLILPSLARNVPESKVESLRRAVSIKPESFPDQKISRSAKLNSLYKGAVILAEAGLREDAASMLHSLLSRLPSDRGLALCTIRALSDAGDYRASLGLIATHFSRYLLRPAQDIPSDFWSLAFPRPFWREISSAAAAQGVDPMLMLALMRQESRFDSTAVSSVGAVGLFQIMPYTADKLAPEVGLREIGEADLKEPRVNALLAARLLAFLMREFDGFYVPAIAAYNAGEDRVGAWWLTGRVLPDDLFIDSIPYQQTRHFVRQVLTNYFTYNRLYPVVVAGEGG